MTAGPPDIVVVGDVMTDVVVRLNAGRDAIAGGSDTPASIRIGGGGAGGNVAAWLAHLGVPVGLVACVGDDPAGRGAVAELTRAGVAAAVRADPATPTGTVVALADAGGERTMMTDRGANLRLRPDDLPDGWFRAGGHLHLSGYVLFDEEDHATGAAALDRAARAGMSTSVDPASWAPLRRMTAERFLELTATAQLCLPNADEARVLTGTADPRRAARQLAAHHGAAVVTCGADGAVWSDGSALRLQAAVPTTVVDATGAGDAFVAGYLAAHIRGDPPGVALERAADAAAQTVRAPGARPAR